MSSSTTVRANVFVDDVGTEFRRLGQEFDDAEHLEELVHWIVRLKPHEVAELPRRLGPMVPMLRESARNGFCVVHELRAHYAHELSDELGVDPGAVYTIPIDISGVRSTWCTAMASDAITSPRRPYPHDKRDTADVDALVAALALRVRSTLGGAERVKAAPLLAPVCAMAMSVRALAKRAQQDFGDCTPIVGAALDALALGTHRRTAERILIADDVEHIALDVRNVPPRFLQGDSVAQFVHGTNGRLAMRPFGFVAPNRILRALMTEPL